MTEAVTFGLWVLVVLALSPSFYRFALGTYSDADEARTGKFFMALLWAAGLGRLIWASNNMQLRTAIIALSGAVATYLLLVRAKHWR